MSSAAFFVDNAISGGPAVTGCFFCAAEFVIKLIPPLFGSRCFLGHNDFWLRASVIYWDYFL